METLSVEADGAWACKNNQKLCKIEHYKCIKSQIISKKIEGATVKKLILVASTNYSIVTNKNNQGVSHRSDDYATQE